MTMAGPFWLRTGSPSAQAASLAKQAGRPFSLTAGTAILLE